MPHAFRIRLNILNREPGKVAIADCEESSLDHVAALDASHSPESVSFPASSDVQIHAVVIDKESPTPLACLRMVRGVSDRSTRRSGFHLPSFEGGLIYMYAHKVPAW